MAGRSSYAAFGMVVDSEIPLELPAGSGAPDVLLDLGAERHVPCDGWTGDPNRQPACTHIRDGERDRLRFAAAAEFVLHRGSGRIECAPHPDMDLAVVGSLFVDHVLPRWLGSQGETVFHASAAAPATGAAAAFVGQSGWGKSTLAASLAAVGWDHLSDDGVRVVLNDGPPTVVPSHPAMRLLPDSANALRAPGEGARLARVGGDKRSFDRFGAAPGRSPATGERRVLGAVFALVAPADAEKLAIDRLGFVDAVTVLVNRSFALTGQNGRVGAQLFSRCAHLASLLPVYRLEYPRRFELLDEVHRLIADAVGGEA